MLEVFNLDFIMKALVLPLTAVKKKSYETGVKPCNLSSFAHLYKTMYFPHDPASPHTLLSAYDS
jgi:hypothetical protein